MSASSILILKKIPRIRSLVKLTLPRYFDPNVFIWNRFSRADGLLVDIRTGENENEDEAEWKRLILLRALERAPYRSRIYVEPTCRYQNPDIWRRDIITCAHDKLHGFLIRAKDSEAMGEAFELINSSTGRPNTRPKCRLDNDMFPSLPLPVKSSIIVDVEQKLIPYVIIKYYNSGETARPTQNQKLLEMVECARKAGVLSLASRATKLDKHQDMETEFRGLKRLGFSGVLLKNPDWIELANDVFK